MVTQWCWVDPSCVGGPRWRHTWSLQFQQHIPLVSVAVARASDGQHCGLICAQWRQTMMCASAPVFAVQLVPSSVSHSCGVRVAAFSGAQLHTPSLTLRVSCPSSCHGSSHRCWLVFWPSLYSLLQGGRKLKGTHNLRLKRFRPAQTQRQTWPCMVTLESRTVDLLYV